MLLLTVESILVEQPPSRNPWLMILEGVAQSRCLVGSSGKKFCLSCPAVLRRLHVSKSGLPEMNELWPSLRKVVHITELLPYLQDLLSSQVQAINFDDSRGVPAEHSLPDWMQFRNQQDAGFEGTREHLSWFYSQEGSHLLYISLITQLQNP